MDPLTRLIAPLFPGLAASRIAAQARLKSAQRLYEAASVSNQHPRRGRPHSADTVTDHAKDKLRNYARWLDENHDLAVGVLDDLVANIVGSGVTVEPLANRSNGESLDSLNDQLRDAWQDFWRFPDVTQDLPGPELERLICRSWLRDGEVFIQHVNSRASLRYPSALPYLLEPLEADFVPFELNSDNITHGVQKNAWGQPIGYYVYKQHPGNTRMVNLDTKFIPFDAMMHLKLTKRLHQTRGVTLFHAVLNRLDDLKDYEESERIAARIAAAFTAYIKRNGDNDYPEALTADLVDGSSNRSFEMSPGMIWDKLVPGEDVGMIKSDRPNPNLERYRDAMLRAIASGTGTRFSSVAKNYNGSYSAQRQELIEGSLSYRRLFTYLRDQFYLPTWRKFIDTLNLAGQIRIPRDINLQSLYRPEFRQPMLPWIDPAKEATAFEKFIAMGVKSRWQIIRDTGGDPRIVDALIKADTLDVRPVTDATPVAPTEPAAADTTDDPADTASTDDEPAQRDNVVNLTVNVDKPQFKRRIKRTASGEYEVFEE